MLFAPSEEVVRCDSPVPHFSLIDEMIVERGTKADWDALHALHYKAETLPAGCRFYRCRTRYDELVGVVVLSSVSLLLAPRHKVFPNLKPGNDTNLSNVHRATWLNANLRRASRIVTDTRYRGAGISYRMLNLAMRLEGFRFVEIQSSMSKFNPFDVKAGFKHAHLTPAAAYQQGFSFFRSLFKSHPADHQAIMQEISELPLTTRPMIEKKMRNFYFRHSCKEKTGSNLNAGTDKVDQMPIDQLVKELQQLVFASPVYGIWKNPDFGREDIPASLPLSAFDLQSPNEPLRTSSL